MKLDYKKRAYIYAVALAAGPVLVYFGLLEPEALPVLAPLALALLNVRDAE